MPDFQTQHRKVVDFILKTFNANSPQVAEGGLKYPYLSPGCNSYSHDLWDWDSYWIIVAMTTLFRETGRDAELQKFAPYAVGCFLNFLDHQGEDGALPIMIRPACEDPFFCKQSPDNNMAKPFIGQMGKVLYDNKLINTDDLVTALPKIRRYHECYRTRYLHPATGLVIWGKDWGIGVDDDPAAWGRPYKSCASIFLNSFLYRDYVATAELAEALNLKDLAAEYAKLRDDLAASIEKYCRDTRENAYFSVDVQCAPNLYEHPVFHVLNQNLDTFWHCLKLKVLSWSSILPFWCGLGTDEMFAKFVNENLTPERLMGKFGVRALSADESMYQPEVGRGNPSNWLGPIWIVANYIVWDALRKRGFADRADQLAELINQILYQDVETNGCFHEYYSPETGLGVFNPHFMSWNSLAALMVTGK